ncbi:hypothetical protein OQA88_11514 [Cercophora sp. LCS_1]
MARRKHRQQANRESAPEQVQNPYAREDDHIASAGGGIQKAPPPKTLEKSC